MVGMSPSKKLMEFLGNKYVIKCLIVGGDNNVHLIFFLREDVEGRLEFGLTGKISQKR